MIDYTPNQLKGKIYEADKLLKDAKKYFASKDIDNGLLLLAHLRICCKAIEGITYDLIRKGEIK